MTSYPERIRRDITSDSESLTAWASWRYLSYRYLTLIMTQLHQFQQLSNNDATLVNDDADDKQLHSGRIEVGTICYVNICYLF